MEIFIFSMMKDLMVDKVIVLIVDFIRVSLIIGMEKRRVFKIVNFGMNMNLMGI